MCPIRLGFLIWLCTLVYNTVFKSFFNFCKVGNNVSIFISDFIYLHYLCFSHYWKWSMEVSSYYCKIACFFLQFCRLASYILGFCCLLFIVTTCMFIIATSSWWIDINNYFRIRLPRSHPPAFQSPFSTAYWLNLVGSQLIKERGSLQRLSPSIMKESIEE